jgi:2-polyprenyl-3-methyl-5-hydroxy-6-metoxy-1,4-benzoquinol methylase
VSIDVDRWVYEHQYKQSQPTREELKVSFAKTARWYAKKLGPFLPPDSEAQILDMACGEGRFLFFLRQQGYSHAWGVDADPGRVDTAQGLGLDARISDCLDVIRQQAPDSLDVVVCMDFLEHLEKGQVIPFLQAVHRAAAPGGRLIVRMPCADGLMGARDWCNDLTHKWAATSGVLEGLLRAIGFGQVRILDERPVPYHWRNKIRLACFHLAKLLMGALLLMSGLGIPRVWSTSMWAVCRK